MATASGYVYDETFIAASDMRLKQGYFVNLTAKDTVDVVASATAAGRTLGVLLNKPNIGQPALVRILGKAVVVSDGSGTAIAVGDLVGPSATGTAIKHMSSGNIVSGQSNDVSSAAGSMIEIFLVPFSSFTTPA